MTAPRFALALLLTLLSAISAAQAADPLAAQAEEALARAARFYREQVASHGGYVYHYALDLSRRWGEGEATADQIWVQPPGTPTVGMAFLRAYEATGNNEYLQAATAAAEALVHGQIVSGGWTNCIDFDPRGKLVAMYRTGGRGRDTSSLDDGQTQSAIQLLVQVDAALNFQHAKIHEAALFALDALLAAQFPNGAFPQVWTKPVTPQPPRKASYPPYDWRTEGKIKNYWDMYTLNDNTTGYIAEALIDAHRIYQDGRYLQALRKLGDFLIDAQMPPPQAGWAQQYNYDMQPIWARRFEPPGVASDETQEAIVTLMRIATVTGEDKYLEPIPAALTWLKKSRLPDGQLARYYELKTNRPLYMNRQEDQYSLTYDDRNLPDHYGWKIDYRVPQLEREFQEQKKGKRPGPERISERDVRQVIASLDPQGRWISTFRGERLVGQLKLPAGTPYLSSAVFSHNVELLSTYLQQAHASSN